MPNDASLPTPSRERLVKLLTLEILSSIQPQTTAFAERIKYAYEGLAGEELINDEASRAPVLLLGLPGTGKNALLRAASQKAATALGMEFLEGAALGNTSVIDPSKHFVFVQQEASNILEALGEEGIGDQALKQLQKASQAGAAVVVFDSLEQAEPTRQNVVMSVLNEREYSPRGIHLDNALVCVAANTGPDEATGPYPIPKYLVTHAQVFVVEAGPLPTLGGEQPAARKPGM